MRSDTDIPESSQIDDSVSSIANSENLGSDFKQKILKSFESFKIIVKIFRFCS